MKRIVLRHLSGSKANQVEEFPLNHFEELVIGRDDSANVKFDPDKDDLVGRQHAKIVREGPDSKQFMITDMGSRNGTYVNKERILGTVNIGPGDVIQFGPGGPEFQFDLEPRPEGLAARPTRVATDATTAVKNSTVPQTRVAESGSSAAALGTRTNVGKTTVMRLISQTKGESRKWTALVAVAILLVVGAVGGGSLYWMKYRAAATAADTDAEIKALGDRASKVEEKTAAMSPAEIAGEYTDATVYIQSSWQLVQTGTGQPLRTMYIPNRYRFKDQSGKVVEGQYVPDGRQWIAIYKQVSTNRGAVIEPVLGTDGPGIPVGYMSTGSGFVITTDGFILTNSHVAESWKVSYGFSRYAFPGLVVRDDGSPVIGQDGQPQLIPWVSWVPGNTKQFGESELGKSAVVGRHDSLTVTFPKTENRIPAGDVRSSTRHDVAIMKINVPSTLKKVELNDNYETIKPGDACSVLGYPASSPPEIGVITSKARPDFHGPYQVGVIPNATLSVGFISRILRGQDEPGKDLVFSDFGDIYQLTVNTTGGGNSGGPVFDDRGRVIALFTYRVSATDRPPDFHATGAVPVKFAKDLLEVTKIMK